MAAPVGEDGLGSLGRKVLEGHHDHQGHASERIERFCRPGCLEFHTITLLGDVMSEQDRNPLDIPYVGNSPAIVKIWVKTPEDS